jgi:type 1 glutamine amidotransferase
MKNFNGMNRRKALGAALAAVASPVIGASSSAAAPLRKAQYSVRPKGKGETKVVYLGGDILHCGYTQDISLRTTFRPTGWRFLSMTDARYLTPEFLSDADLLIITRWGGPIIGWSPGPIVERSLDDMDGYMSDELENAIVENVMNRGMGFISLHCTIWTPEKKKFTEMMGIKGRMHGPIQTVHLHNFNQDHPITKGFKDFDIGLDENFGVELTNSKAVPLYETTGANDKRHDIAGWCVEQGKGRVVGLGIGHTHEPWLNATCRELHWRAAHWAMKKVIPEFKPTQVW